MAESSQHPFPSQPGPVPGQADTTAGQRRLGPGLVAFAAVVLGSALLGLLAGFVWLHLAPRPLYIVVSGGAEAVNPEDSAFIGADSWFCVVGIAGGIISGLLGYLLAVRRHGAFPMAGILSGGLAAAYIAMWIGQRSGMAAFFQRLAASKPGTLLRAPIKLDAHGALAFWPPAWSLAVSRRSCCCVSSGSSRRSRGPSRELTPTARRGRQGRSRRPGRSSPPGQIAPALLARTRSPAARPARLAPHG